MGVTYVTGDIHMWRDIDKITHINTKELGLSSKSDYLIILGDTGFLWNDSVSSNKLLNYFNRKPYTTLFIDGNHENFSNLNNKPIVKKFGGKVHRLSKNIYHLMRGNVYNINRKSIYTFGGAISIDACTRIPGTTWWSEEVPSSIEIQHGLSELQNCNKTVDYILTHDCSKITRHLINHNKKFKDTDDIEFQEFLKYLEDNVDFKHWYFGHYHLDSYIDDKHTVVFNKLIKLK